MTDKITVICAYNKSLNKKFTLENGEIIKSDYGSETYFTPREFEYKNLFAFSGKLREMENRPKLAIVRGTPFPHKIMEELEAVRSANPNPHPRDKDPLFVTSLYPNKTTGEVDTFHFYQRRKTLFADRPKHLVCMDIDKYVIEGMKFELTQAGILSYIDHFVEHELGSDFVNVDYAYQLSASCGMPGREDSLSAHVWFWVDKPMDGFAWKQWFKYRKTILGRRSLVDPSLFRVVSIHYTAKPSLGEGIADPIAAAGLNRVEFIEKFGGNTKVTISNLAEIEAFAEDDRVNYELSSGDSDAEEREDAFNRPGIIGAFNRTYTISTIINNFLADVFRVDDMQGRVTYLLSESGAAGGCRIYACNTKLWNGHNSDPLENRLATAFDLICHYVCDGDFREALAWCREQPGVLDAETADEFEESSFVDTITPTAEAPGVGIAEKPKKKKEESADEILATYPPLNVWWGPKGTTIGYKKDATGDWRFYVNKANENGELQGETKKWSPITLVGDIKCRETGDESVKFKIRGTDGNENELEISRGDITETGLAQSLRKKGFRASFDASKEFANYIVSGSASKVITTLPRRGWSEDFVFACPDGTIIGAKDKRETIELKSASVLAPGKGREGTLEDWKRAISIALEVTDTPHWTLGTAIGFCGPLMTLLSLPTVGISFIGKTSRGKSIALELATSVWSYPEPGKGGLARTFRTSAAAVDAIAAEANGTILAYDELNTAPKKDIQGIIYTISSGVGKETMQQDRSIRKNEYRWSTFCVMTGEMTAAEYLYQATNKTIHMGKGVEARFWDIGVSGLNQKVEQKVISDFQKDGIRKSYGLAGPTFVQALFDKGFVDDPRELVLRHREIVKTLVGVESGKLGRTAEIPAIIILAGQLACEFDILPSGAGERVAEAVMGLWGDYKAGPAASEDLEVRDNINQWIMERLNNSVVPAESRESSRANVRDGWYDDDFYYLTGTKLIEAAGAVLPRDEILATLKRLNLIGAGRSDVRKTRYVPKQGALEAYPLIRIKEGNNGFGRLVDDEQEFTETPTPDPQANNPDLIQENPVENVF